MMAVPPHPQPRPAHERAGPRERLNVKATSDRRLEILRSSARLFSQQSVARTTVREIAEDVGINSGTLYYYFRSKDEIASEILIAFLTDLTASYEDIAGATARADLHRIIEVSLTVAARHPYATEIYQNEFESLPSLPRYIDIKALVGLSHQSWSGVIDRGVQRGELRADFASGLAHQILREVVWAMVRWNREDLAPQVAHLATLLTSIFVDGLGYTDHRPPLPVAPPSTAASAADPSPTPNGAAAPEQSAVDELATLRSEMREMREGLNLIREALAGGGGDKSP